MDNQYYLFAGKDIYKNDRMIYLKDELIGNVSILKNEKDIKNVLPEGVYYIKQNKEKHNHEIYIEERMENWQYLENVMLKQEKMTINLKVIDSLKKNIIIGVHCGIFAGEDIYDKNNILVYFKDDLIMDVYSNEDIKVPLFNIGEGTFYIQQLNTLEGYFGNINQFYITLNSNENNKFNVIIENEPTIIEILQKDQNNHFVKGSWLILYDEKGRIVDEWISEKEHIVYNLNIGHRYVIKEKKTSDGYHPNEETSFFVENNRGVQRILIRNYKEGS